MKDKIVIFLRKKIEGQNSIEKIAEILNEQISNSVIKILPSYGRSPLGMIKNIVFAIKNQGKINHLISPSDPYIVFFLGGKKILTWHDVKTLFQSKSKIKRFYRKLLYLYPTLFFDKITTISNFTKKELLNYLPSLKENKITIIPNPVNDGFRFCPKQELSDPPVIFHPGTVKRKNLDLVIKAIEGLNVKLNIVGKLSNEQEILLQKYHINYSNDYDIPVEKMIKCYQECDIVSFPSSYEGFGVPIIEAQMIGRPIILSKIDVLKDVSGNISEFVDLTSESIRHAIINLLNNNTYRYDLINKGYENALKYTSKNICNQYLSLYNQ